MPAPKDLNKAEFYVYRLFADGVPFYVGIGRSARASDRVRYIGNLSTREASGKPVKWTLHTRTISELLRAGCDIQVHYAVREMTRANALVKERSEITDLLVEGYTLLNIQHNPQRPKSAEQVIEPVLLRSGRIAADNLLKPKPLSASA